MAEEVRDDVELSSLLLCASLNRVICQHPKLFCLPLYWTQRQWSILRVQILHDAYNAERQSGINLRLPKFPVYRVRQCIGQLNCSLWFRDRGGEWELAHVDGSHLTEARRRHPMKSRYRIPGDESQRQNNLFCIPAFLIAMAQNRQYRQQLQPTEPTVSARMKCSRFCVLFTDSEADNTSVHLYSTSSPDILMTLLQTPEKPLHLETPWPSHMPFLAIEHTPVAYKPYRSFRIRLRNAIFQTQDSAGLRKRKQSQATSSPDKKRCTHGN
ncbi:hypothetical protein F5Y14DRAFT_444199 [Nemania sp. NC0429]|nr:hypothetical protein F5Y14DRAFT_444199 [Nemania sp. NC0429]